MPVPAYAIVPCVLRGGGTCVRHGAYVLLPRAFLSYAVVACMPVPSPAVSRVLLVACAIWAAARGLIPRTVAVWLSVLCPAAVAGRRAVTRVCVDVAYARALVLGPHNSPFMW